MNPRANHSCLSKQRGRANAVLNIHDGEVVAEPRGWHWEGPPHPPVPSVTLGLGVQWGIGRKRGTLPVPSAEQGATLSSLRCGDTGYGTRQGQHSWGCGIRGPRTDVAHRDIAGSPLMGTWPVGTHVARGDTTGRGSGPWRCGWWRHTACGDKAVGVTSYGDTARHGAAPHRTAHAHASPPSGISCIPPSRAPCSHWSSAATSPPIEGAARGTLHQPRAPDWKRGGSHGALSVWIGCAVWCAARTG